MSKNQPAVSLIHVPDRFSVVEQGVYRCASPTALQVPFLASLQLRTIISLTPEFPVRQLIAFTRASGIDFLHYGTTLWRPSLDWKPITDDIVKATLETVLDVRNHPVLLIDPLGIHQTGCVVGALRTMQGWNFASALVEYQSHSGPSKHRIADEHYIELFEPDLINLPSPQFVPDWFRPLEMDNDAATTGIWEGEGEEYVEEDDNSATDGGKAVIGAEDGHESRGEACSMGQGKMKGVAEREEVERDTGDAGAGIG